MKRNTGARLTTFSKLLLIGFTLFLGGAFYIVGKIVMRFIEW